MIFSETNLNNLLENIKQLYERAVEDADFWKEKYFGFKKDEEIRKLEDEKRNITEHSLLIMSDKEREANSNFIHEHYTIHGGGKCLNTYIYTLSGTGIGTVIKIKCPVCGEEKDITDTSSW